MDILNNSCALWREKRGNGSQDAAFDIQLDSVKLGCRAGVKKVKRQNYS
jgi:hypothetical protein